MKRLLTIITLLSTLSLTAQTKQKSKVVTKPNYNKELVKIKALNWFKKYYVEDNFKDPYSYKPLSTRVYVTTYGELLEKDTTNIGNDIVILRYKADSTNYDMLKYYKERYISDSTMLSYRNNISNEYLIKQDLENISKERKEYLDNKSLLDSNIVLYNKICDRLVKLSTSERNKIAYYDIYHDCYGNNSYGMKVLGKYYFRFTFEKLGYDVEKYN